MVNFEFNKQKQENNKMNSNIKLIRNSATPFGVGGMCMIDRRLKPMETICM